MNTHKDDGSELDARKLAILKAVIDDYITSVVPVGSRTLSKKLPLGLSSATIRNEMADLEEMGYLSQPHASAGRIPSNKGYRAYVDSMLSLGNVDSNVSAKIVSMLENKMLEYGKLMHAAAQMISEITHCAAIAVSSPADNLVIKACQLVPVEAGKILVVVVTENNIIKNRMISLTENVTPDQVIELSAVVNSHFSGKPADQISLVTINDIVKETGIERELLLPVVDGIIECIRQYSTREIIKEGTANLLDFPEFSEVGKIRETLALLSDNDLLTQLILDESPDAHEISRGLSVRIGNENSLSALQDYSVVTATYSIDGVEIGTIGVLGPTRMDYSKVVNSLDYIRRLLDDKINNMEETDG